MVYIMSRKPIQTLYNYPPKIQERVKSLEEYKDQIPTEKNKLVAKGVASILFVVVLSLIRILYSRVRKTWWMSITTTGFTSRASLLEKAWHLLFAHLLEWWCSLFCEYLFQHK